MSGNKLLLDTNIALYLLGGDEVLATLLDQREVFVSVISEMEMLGYPGISLSETYRIKDFLKDCQIVELVPSVKELAIEIRKAHGLKLPDAIIAASALHLNLPLVSADKVFNRIDDLNFVLYEI